MNTERIEDACKKFINIHDKGVNAENRIDECLHFKYRFSETSDNEILLVIQICFIKIKKNCKSPIIPSILICFRIYLSLMITNRTGERPFSYA